MHVVAVCIIAAVLVVLMIQAFGQAYREDGNDYTSYLLSARALLHGENPYKTASPFCYIYPLFLAFILIPLDSIPYGLSVFIWYWLSVACILASCWMLLRIASREVKANIGLSLSLPSLIVFLVMLSSIQSNLLNGQVNPLVLFCCVMFLRNFVRDRGVVAAVWLGAAIALKLVPAILLLFLLVRRQYRVMAWTVLFCAMFCLAPGIILGQNILTLYGNYLDAFIRPSLENPGAFNKGVFFSLQGTIEYFTGVARTNRLLGGINLLATLTALLAVDLPSIKSPRLHRDVWPFCAYLLGCLFLSPASETHHLVLALPAIFLIAMKLYSDRLWTNKTVCGLAVLFVACFAVAAQAYRTMPFFFASLAILLVLLFLANRQPQPADGASNHCGLATGETAVV